MTDLVDDLKQNKEEIEYKLVQFEDIIKCQKLDIESKSNLIKKFELVIFVPIITFKYFQIQYLARSRFKKWAKQNKRRKSVS